MGDRHDWERQVMELRESLEHAVVETGSLTSARVLQISAMLDEALVAHLRAQQEQE